MTHSSVTDALESEGTLKELKQKNAMNRNNGPALRSNSGSEVVGKLPPKRATVDPTAIQWLMESTIATTIRMNPQHEISVREAFSPGEMPAESPAFWFTGTRGELAACLIERDSAQWDCADYIIFDKGPANGGDHGTRHWSVWRR